jgi:hypothetical protein|tara:strand:- start:22 stop:156 length:135 start_codon:yes stop_codon:yes gene_type:complete
MQCALETGKMPLRLPNVTALLPLMLLNGTAFGLVGAITLKSLHS